jgi:hypothetical protein
MSILSIRNIDHHILHPNSLLRKLHIEYNLGLLNQVQYLPYIPMMKDREKQLEQDMIWKKVCMDLDWEFFATV